MKNEPGGRPRAVSRAGEGKSRKRAVGSPSPSRRKPSPQGRARRERGLAQRPPACLKKLSHMVHRARNPSREETPEKPASRASSRQSSRGWSVSSVSTPPGRGARAQAAPRREWERLTNNSGLAGKKGRPRASQ